MVEKYICDVRVSVQNELAEELEQHFKASGFVVGS